MHIPRSASAVLAALTLSAVLVACGGDDATDVPPETELSPPVGGNPVPTPVPTPAIPTDPSPTS